MSESHVVTIGFGNSPKPVRAKFIRGQVRAAMEEQLREVLQPWGLPLEKYRFTAERTSTPTYQDHHGEWQGWIEDIPVTATFRHRWTGAKVVITEIWLGEDGEILQHGTQYGDLVL